MSVYLLDANVLISLVNQSHLHHSRARDWFLRLNPQFATCPITQGALVRHYFRDTESPLPGGAIDLIAHIEKMPGHEFWKDDVSYSAIQLTGIIGYRQVTDAYLAGLARKHKGKLATMDKGMLMLHPDVCELLE